MKFTIYHDVYKFEIKIERFLLEREDTYSLFFDIL